MADGGPGTIIAKAAVGLWRFVPYEGADLDHRPSLDAALVGEGAAGLTLRRYAEGSTPGGFLGTYPVRTVPMRVVLDGRQGNGGT
ncbi:hypothetical protein ABN028_12180 [Actinopolymorpha sp. B17G11]|uniref:hypothetical protein n=1 Tax=unclassified Actinopolymorpha TaxID=2627063 RepID=UPI0032D8ED70